MFNHMRSWHNFNSSRIRHFGIEILAVSLMHDLFECPGHQFGFLLKLVLQIPVFLLELLYGDTIDFRAFIKSLAGSAERFCSSDLITGLERLRNDLIFVAICRLGNLLHALLAPDANQVLVVSYLCAQSALFVG